MPGSSDRPAIALEAEPEPEAEPRPEAGKAWCRLTRLTRQHVWFDWHTQAAREQCAAAGCEVREVAPLPLPPGVGGPPSYACEHFADCWTKLRVWELEDEFGRNVDSHHLGSRGAAPQRAFSASLGCCAWLWAALRTLEERPCQAQP